MAVEEPPADPNEPKYCRCQNVSYGEMVACDNNDCPIEWFHFACVGLTAMVRSRACGEWNGVVLHRWPVQFLLPSTNASGTCPLCTLRVMASRCLVVSSAQGQVVLQRRVPHRGRRRQEGAVVGRAHPS